jgi:hypothetical protein
VTVFAKKKWSRQKSCSMEVVELFMLHLLVYSTFFIEIYRMVNNTKHTDDALEKDFFRTVKI